MSWRSNAQRTGMNAQPLQGARRWGGGAAAGGDGGPSGSGSPSSNYQQSHPYQSSYHQQHQQQPSHPYNSPPSASTSSSNPRDAALAAAAAVAASIGIKRDRDSSSHPSSYGAPSSSSASASDPTGADGGPRKRKSRWGDATDKITIPTAIGANVSAEELDKYAIQVRLDEISRKLRSGDFIPPDRERSPSPPPTYDNQGRRTNTREVRYRKKLEDERVSLVDRQLKLDPNFRPPSDYHAIKRNQRPTEKVYLPIKEFPEINFFGLLVGPRGNTLKTMERQSGAKISIRGKGSVKEGKGKGGDEDEEEMHCVVAADDEAAVKKCIKLINQVIETAASTPEGENDHKRNQLRELAALNGTLRDDENQLCKNCGNKGHRAFECPEQRNWTAHIICHRCGGQGHLARDCTQGRAGNFGPAGGAPGGPTGPGGAPGTGNRQFDSEYANLMAELGEPSAAGAGAGAGAGAAPTTAMNGGSNGAPAVGADGKKIPPWRNPEVWTQPGFGASRGGGGPDSGRGGWGHHRGGYNNRGDRNGAGYNSHPYQQQPYQGPYHHQQQQQPYAGAYDQSQPTNTAATTAAAGEEGQKDYSAEWAAYYAAQAAYADPNAAAAAAAAAGGGANAAQTGEGAGQQVDYTKEWEEYYRMQAAAAAQEGGAAYGASAGQAQI
ncbi:related to MSL5 - branch point bridging protein [Ustilago trichophora]|uniref:Branchpoint-bridging protein n=1 Tax=Ustilago trichophora TaxID=86804 RepID=A0A5C3EME7_9BASI|nr:related to MSL5 - branch point bridging protein [Ustilago trichophora]